VNYLAVWLPWLPSERARRARLVKPDAPFALVEKVRGAQRLAAVDARAAALGIEPGLTLADARARIPELDVLDHAPEADRALLDWLVEACDRYTPSVMAVPPAALVMDITGCTHSFGNEVGQLAGDLAKRLHRMGITSRLSFGATPDAALARARFGLEDLARLPVEALAVEPETHRALRRAGLRTLGEIAQRPRANLATRFGKGLTDSLDRVLERIDAKITPHRVIEDVAVEARFAEPVARTEDALATIARLIGEAAIELGARGVGGRRFDVALFRSDGHVARLSVETAAPTRDPAPVERLLRERIDALSDPLDPGFGYDLIRLVVPVAEPLSPAQLRLEGGSLAGAEMSALIDRLVARFGRNRVRRFASADTHIPEQASFTLPVGDQPAAPMTASEPGEPPQRPLHLFDPPQRIQVTAEVPDGPPLQFGWRRGQHRIARYEGPERIAAEWWRRAGGHDPGQGGLTRDYYRVEDTRGRRYWVFRHGLYGERHDPAWYVHGIFA